MKIKILILFLALNIANSVYAKSGKDSINQNKNTLHLSLLKFVGTTNPRVEFAYERMYLKHLSSSIKLGWIYPNYLVGDKISRKLYYRGFVTSFDQKYYFKKNFKGATYVGIEAEYLQNKKKL